MPLMVCQLSDWINCQWARIWRTSMSPAMHARHVQHVKQGSSWKWESGTVSTRGEPDNRLCLVGNRTPDDRTCSKSTMYNTWQQIGLSEQRISGLINLEYTIRSDGGPCNTTRFPCTWEMGINHMMSSTYNPSSNGASERGVQQIKKVLEKTGKKRKISEQEWTHKNKKEDKIHQKKNYSSFQSEHVCQTAMSEISITEV